MEFLGWLENRLRAECYHSAQKSLVCFIFKTSDIVYEYRRIGMKAQAPPAIRFAFKAASVLRTRDLESHGIWRAKLRDFVVSGVLQRVGRGLYSRAGFKAGRESLSCRSRETHSTGGRFACFRRSVFTD